MAPTMSSLDEILEGNARFVEDAWDTSEASMDAIPRKRLAVVACMDARYSIHRVLDLQHGDAKIIRNAGNIVDRSTLRSLAVAVHLLEVDTIVVLGHSDCGMQKVAEGEPGHEVIQEHARELTGSEEPPLPEDLGGFHDPEANVRQGVERIRKHPLLPGDLTVEGYVYENDTGRIHAVKT